MGLQMHNEMKRIQKNKHVKTRPQSNRLRNFVRRRPRQHDLLTFNSRHAAHYDFSHASAAWAKHENEAKIPSGVSMI